MNERNKLPREIEEKIIEYYKNHSKKDTCDEFNIGYGKLSTILNKYDIHRDPSEKGKFIAEKISRKLTLEEENNIINYYKNHSIPEVSSYFNIPADWITHFLRDKGLTRQGEERHSFIANKRKINSKKTINELKGEEITNYYLNHGTKATCNYFNIGLNRLYTICEEQGVKIRNKEESKQMREQTCLKHFGTKSPIENPEIWKKKEQTSLEKYGVTNIAFLPEVIEKRKQTNLKLYGNENPSATEEIKEKVANTNFKKFGVKSMFYLKEIQDKRKEKALKLYGSESPFADPKIFKKAKETMKQKYGVENTLQSSELRSKQAKTALNSSLEKRVEEFLINNNFIYSKQYNIERDNLNHSFDFAIFKDDKLEILLDCDGLFYHGYLTDEDGKKVNSYSDNYRQMLVPDHVKFLILLEGQEEETYKELMNLYNISYDDYIEEIFKWCREVTFPYPQYEDRVLINSYKSLIKADVNKFNMKARYGNKVINHFHPSIFKAKVGKNLSLYEAWQDDNLIVKCIKNRIIYKGTNLDRSKILAGLNIAKIAPKISIFNPYLAKYLIEKYLNNYGTIFDPFSGYSGRMLGTCSLNKKYIGQDLNSTTVEESNNIIKFFSLDAEINQKDILKDSGAYECLFTCPPYNLKETWGQQIEDKSCDGWIDECIKRYKCEKYLFVVDNTEEYKNNIVEEIINKSHFGENKEYIILIEAKNE